MYTEAVMMSSGLSWLGPEALFFFTIKSALQTGDAGFVRSGPLGSRDGLTRNAAEWHPGNCRIQHFLELDPLETKSHDISASGDGN